MTFLHSKVNEEEINLPIGETGYLRIPLRIAERYLTENTENNSAKVQPIGTDIQILIRSKRDDMIIRIPLENWEAAKPYNRSLNGWTLNLKKWIDNIHINKNGKVVAKIYTADEI